MLFTCLANTKVLYLQLVVSSITIHALLAWATCGEAGIRSVFLQQMNTEAAERKPIFHLEWSIAKDKPGETLTTQLTPRRAEK